MPRDDSRSAHVDNHPIPYRPTASDPSGIYSDEATQAQFVSIAEEGLPPVSRIHAENEIRLLGVPGAIGMKPDAGPISISQNSNPS